MAATPGCVSIVGEPGIGKTRLLAELRERAEERRHIVLSGVASEFERDIPFSVFVDALDAYVASQDLRARDGWSADLERELGRILPSLAGERAGVGVLPDERYRAHRAMTTLLALLAETKPLVLVLDDLQWADAASLELVPSLVSRGPDAPVLVALGMRPGGEARRLSTALAGASVTRLEPQPLSEAEAGTLLRLGSGAVAELYGHTGGNPFYLEQLGRTGSGGQADGNVADLGVPPVVAASLAAEVALLPDDVRVFAGAAAVAGEPFEPDLAATIAGMGDDEALGALDDLLERDVVRPTSVPRRFRFRHPLVREGVYESTPGGWRLAAHERAAHALAEQGAGAGERAIHVEQSARQGDETAVALLLEAGRSASARAPAVAARWFDAALRLLPNDDAEREVDVRVELASALRSLGRLDACRTALLEAAARLPADAVARRVELVARCAAVEHWQGRHDEARKRLSQAWEELPDRGTAEAVALRVELAVDALYVNDFERCVEMGSAALETARTLEDSGLVAMVAAALSLGEAASMLIDDARRHHAEAVAALERVDDDELAPRLETLYYLGWAENYLEHYDDAHAHAERGVAIARATGEGRLLVPLMLLRAYPLEMQGRLTEAREICDTAVEIARVSENRHLLFWALFELAFALYYQGEFDASIAAAEESAQVGGRMVGGTMPSAGGGPGWALATSLFELGDVERASALMQELGGPGMRNWVPIERPFNWENLVFVELARGDLGAADRMAKEAEDAASGTDLRLSTALAARSRAAVELARGEPAAAVAHAEASIAAADAIGAGLHAAFSRTLLGRALSANGERDRAITELREADGALSDSGSLRMRDEARRELRRLGARYEVRGPATPDAAGVASLTGREREIAELVTDRLTNGEIAARLFLSKKTVESHIRNAFHKLGVSSRVEVARVIERQRADDAG